MPNILNSIFPLYKARDDVGVFDQNGQQIFTEARSIKARVNPSAKLMQHPAETGVTITDHRVVNPTSVELSLIVTADDYQSVYANIQQFFMNGTILSVYCKAGVFDNQVIESLPHEEDPDYQNTLLIVLRLQQILFVTSQITVEPANPTDSTTVDVGVQSAVTAALAPADIAARAKQVRI